MGVQYVGYQRNPYENSWKKIGQEKSYDELFTVGPSRLKKVEPTELATPSELQEITPKNSLATFSFIGPENESIIVFRAFVGKGRSGYIGGLKRSINEPPKPKRNGIKRSSEHSCEHCGERLKMNGQRSMGNKVYVPQLQCTRCLVDFVVVDGKVEQFQRKPGRAASRRKYAMD